MSDYDRAAIVKYNYINTNGIITDRTIHSTWEIFHEPRFWDSYEGKRWH